jgi:hypothetical protein
METTITTTIKKKRKLLFIDFNQVEREEIIKTIKEIREKLIKIFRSHIGKENAINPVELFEQVYNVNPFIIDIYKREYWYNILKAVIRQLKKENSCFVVITQQKLYVLHTEEELLAYKKKSDNHIKNIEDDKTRAEKWIKDKGYRDF